MVPLAAAIALVLPIPCAGVGRTAAQSSALSDRGAPGQVPRPTLRAERLGTELELDGRLDEEAWRRAVPTTAFIQVDPEEGAPATRPTEVRVLVDDEALYIGARLSESNPRDLVARLSRRDLAVESDALEVALDTLHDRLTASVFAVTAAGALRDAAQGSDGSRDDSWDPVWAAAVSRDSLGWGVELRIPFNQLRMEQSGGGLWGIQITRFSSRRQETDVFAFTPKRESAGVDRYGLLDGLAFVRPFGSLELIPYVSSRLEYVGTGPADPFHPPGDLGARVGVDLRAQVGGGLRLNATVRPDFGQVEVDPALVDLSGFETFFPEKRPFFAQGSDLFRFADLRSYKKFDGGQPFHSRRIGRAPQGTVTDPAAASIDQPSETPIDAALKLTGRAWSQWSVGVLDALTGSASARFVDGVGRLQSASVEPLTNYFVARTRRETRSGNTVVGGIVTAVHRDLSDPALRSLLRDRALQAGVDVSHSWGNRSWGLDGSFAATQLHGSAASIDRVQRNAVHYSQRPDRRHAVYDPSRTYLAGHQLQATLTKLSALHWLASASFQEASPGFDANDLGFTRRADFRRSTVYAGYKEDRPGPVFRRWTASAYTRDAWTYDGTLAFAARGIGLKTLLHNYWTVNLDGQRFARASDDRFSRGGPLVKVPPEWAVNATLSSDARRSWQTGSTLLRLWDTHGYDEFTASAFAEYSPSAAVRLRVEPAIQRFRYFAEFVTSVADTTAVQTYGRRYVFAPFAQNSLSLIGRIDWTFTPALSVQLFAQPFVSAARFGAPMELTRGNTYDFARYGLDRGTLSGGDGAAWSVDPDGAGPAAPFAVADPTFGVRSLLSNFVVRWEYRPGSTLYVVWQQTRRSEDSNGDFSAVRDMRTLFGTHPDQVFLVKASWWFSP